MDDWLILLGWLTDLFLSVHPHARRLRLRLGSVDVGWLRFRCGFGVGSSATSRSQSNATPIPLFPRRVTRAVRLRPTLSSSLNVSGIPCMLSTIRSAPVFDISTIEHLKHLRALT
jgi:hypothetical protein